MSDAADPGELTPLKQAFLAIEDLQARLQASERAKREPIAVIGVGCRLPGGVDESEALWALLRDGVDAIGDIPADRWDIDEYFDPDYTAPGKMSTRHGGFIRDVDRFDPLLFGIAPREAAAMDPQQRLLLEVGWEAFEHAGQSPAELAGTRTGVFVGITTGDYAQLTLSTLGLEGLGAYYASGIAHSIASGRLSYVLGLEGPSISIDTACSSSLVATHLAVQSLRTGESDLALAGGVNLMLSPEMSVTLSKYQMMAPDGRCKFGDASADGFVRAEGCALVVLKRLSDALADGDRVLAVIRGSAVSQDGASSGLTAPNGPSQEAVIRAALANAGVRPAEVSYVEAHGTGTSLGDPIEVQALGEVFGPGRPADQPLVVGSVKTNVGHLESAAGVTGLIKLVLMLQHRAIPASLHFSHPSPHIPWDELPITVPVANQAWDPPTGRRLAGLSAFGFSGTNVHMVLEEAPAIEQAPVAVDRPLHLVPLSARTEPALRELAGRYARHLADHPSLDLADVAHTAGTGRSHLGHRLAAVASDTTGLVAQLSAYAAGDESPGLVARDAERADPPKIAFLFTGQGAQRVGMGRELYDTQSVFRASLDRCATILGAHLDVPLLDVLFAEAGSPEAGLLDQTGYTQVAMVAVEWSLAELWRSWGVTPNAVMGHSVGEYTAAMVAGVLALEDGLELVAARGRLMQALPAGGAMAAIFAAPDRVRLAVEANGGGVSVAAHNGPAHTVIAGPAGPVDSIVARFTDDGVRAQRLNVSHAFHSSLLDPMLDELEVAASTVTTRAPRIRLISNLTGSVISRDEITPGYWRRHAREAVRFAEGVAELARLGCDLFVEVGPHPTLLGMAQAVLPDREVWLPSLRKGQGDWHQLLDSVAVLYTHGAAIDWAGVDLPYPRRTVTLPTYPFQRERYWFTSQSTPRTRRTSTGRHALLGERLRSALRHVQFDLDLCTADVDFLDDHRVFGTAILPATGFVEAALSAGATLGPARSLESVELLSALVVGDDETRAVQTILTPDDVGAGFEIFSQGDDGCPDWQLHARGRIVHAASQDAPAVDLDAVRARCAASVSAEEHYALLAERGLEFGPSLRGVRQVWKGDGEVLGEVALAAQPGSYRLHPALLDACLQSLAWLTDDRDATYLPIAIDRLDLYGPAPADDTVWAYAVLRPAQSTHETLIGDVWVYSADGAPVAAARGMYFKRASRDSLLGLARTNLAEWLYEREWRPQPLRGDAIAASPVELLAPAAMVAAAEARSMDLQTEHELARAQRLYDALEAISAQYVLLALEELGVALVDGQHFDVADLGVVEQHRRLVDRLLDGLADDGLLVRDGEVWSVVGGRPEVDLSAWCDELSAAHPHGRGELAIVKRCGEGLAAALRGATDPLQLLFPGGSTESAEQMYRDSPFAHYYNSLVAEAVAVAVAELPAGRPVRVLEIGAGTGGTTGYVLPLLPDGQTEYTYTDVSPLFVERAREKFAAYQFVTYRTLDIEVDPEAQGFGAHQYDLVVAANVLHATAELRRTFDHVARLLAPGGRLVLLEMTKPHRFIDISFGLTPGWWRLTDTELRPDYLLLDRQGWLDFLESRGFGDPDTAPDAAATLGADLSLQTVVVARAPDVAPGPPNAGAGGAWLVLADDSGVGADLAELLTVQGAAVTIVTPDSASDIAVVVAAAPMGGWTNVVHLWSLVAPRETLRATEEHRAGSALAVVRAMLGSSSGGRLWLVTRGGQPVAGSSPDPSQAPLWGLGLVVGLEHPELRCTLIDLDPAPATDAAQVLLAELTAGGDADQVGYRAGLRHSAHLTRRPEAATSSDHAGAALLQLPGTGVLDEMSLRPAARRAPGPGEVEIRVHAAGLNFRDVMNALAMRDDQEAAGSECAGIVVDVGPDVTGITVGDAVIAIAAGCFGTYVTAPAELVVPKPNSITFEEAATLPLAFLTAHYALHGQAHLAAGQTVLIHAAAGGVGLAAVQLAHRAGAHVLGTAGSLRKRAHLSALGLDAVADSRSHGFADDIRAQTGGRGIDVVVNSLTGWFIQRSLELLSDGGRFVELGKREVLDPEQVAFSHPGVSYHTVPLADDIQQRPEVVGPLLRELVAAVETGELRPLPVQAFPLDEAASAFRFMAQARHIGKVVLTDPVAVAELPVGRPLVRDDGTYLITGGLAGLGLLVAEWLVDHGARHLALMARSTPDDGALAAIARMEGAGARVLTLRADVSERGQVEASLSAVAAELPPLSGVFHSAGVLDDGALVRQDWSRFWTVMAPKVDGAVNLHELTRDMPLDHFVLFSSAASLFGSAGQANHAAANAFLDALAAHRRARGLPGLSINWGAWGEVGSVVRHELGDRITTQGIIPMSPRQGLDALRALMAQGRPQVGVVAVDWPVYLRHVGADGPPAWLAEVAMARQRGTTATASVTAPSRVVRDQIEAAPASQRQQLLLDFVSAQVARVLGAGSPEAISERQPLHEMGLDSLMAVELRNVLGSGLGFETSLPATLVFDHPTVEALAVYLADSLSADSLSADSLPPSAAVAPVRASNGEDAHDDLLTAITLMSDEDVARLLGD